MILGLVACSSPSNTDDEILATPTPSEPSQDIDLDHSLDVFEAGNNWHANNLSCQGLENELNINTEVGIDGCLEIDEVYLLKGHHIITVDVLCDIEIEVYFEASEASMAE